MSALEQLRVLIPEIIVAVTAMAILMIWVFSRRDNRWLVMMLVIGSSLVAAVIDLTAINSEPVTIFSGQLTVDRFAVFFRFLFLLRALAVQMSDQWCRHASEPGQGGRRCFGLRDNRKRQRQRSRQRGKADYGRDRGMLVSKHQ